MIRLSRSNTSSSPASIATLSLQSSIVCVGPPLFGTTRATELRDTRRRVLETDRRGYVTLLALTTENRTRLEEEVRQADGLVQRLRQRLNPLIEREIDKLTPQP